MSNLLTFRAGDGSPIAFRLRNLGFHLTSVLLLYALTRRLLRSPAVAAWAACLFGVHPVASVSVVGATWGNTMAHTAALAGLLLFVGSVQEVRRRWLRLGTGLVAACAGLLAYDSDVVVLGLMVTYLALHAWARREPPLERRFLLAFAIGAVTLLGCSLLPRARFLPEGWEAAGRSVTTTGTVVRNVALYSAALASPVDPVLANELLDTPLPSEIRIDTTILAMGGALVVSILALLVWLVLRRPRHVPRLADRFEGTTALFLVLGVAAPLIPVLLLQPHPSETYLYMSVAFYLPLLVHGLHGLAGHGETGGQHTLIRAVLILLLVLFGAATYVRNERLRRCGETAERILRQLPGGRLSEGSWTLWFANVPGEERSRRYACYGFRGTDTIGDGASADGAMTRALQVQFANERLAGRVLDPEPFSQACQDPLPQGHLCLWVHSDGRMEEWSRHAAPP